MDNKLNIIIEFNYKNKNYYIVSKANKIYFAHKDNDEIKFVIDGEERKVFIKIFLAFLINIDKSIKVDKVKIQDREYIIYYDLESGNYFWKDLNNYMDDNEEDNILLNRIYNHQEKIMYSGQITKIDKRKRVYTKLITIGTTVVVAVASAIINPVVLATQYERPAECSKEALHGINNDGQEAFDEIPKIEQNEFEEIDSQIYDWNKMKNAIDQNNNLSDEEKEFFYNLKFVFDQHHDYMDLKLIEQRLRTFHIDYIDEIGRTTDGELMGGGWSSVDNSITLWAIPELYYSGEKHNFQNTDKLVLIHEIAHMLQGIEKNCSRLYEPSAEYLARDILEILAHKNIIVLEKLNKDELNDDRIKLTKGYEEVLPVYYILTRFMTYEEILSFQYSGDMQYIAQALSRYGTEEDAYELLTKIKKTNFNEVWDKENLESIKTIYSKLNDYYIKLTGKNIYDDLEMIAIISGNSLEGEFNDDEKLIKREKGFIELIKKELIESGKINSDKNTTICLNLGDFSYSNKFFKDYKRGLVIYPEIIKNGEDREYMFIRMELTPEMQAEFDSIYQGMEETGFDR